MYFYFTKYMASHHSMTYYQLVNDYSCSLTQFSANVSLTFLLSNIRHVHYLDSLVRRHTEHFKTFNTKPFSKFFFPVLHNKHNNGKLITQSTIIKP